MQSLHMQPLLRCHTALRRAAVPGLRAAFPCSHPPAGHHTRSPSQLLQQQHAHRTTVRAAASISPQPSGPQQPRQPGASDVGPVNKQSPASAMPEYIYRYLLQHIREHPILRQLREETSTMQGSQMQTAPEQGQLLSLLVELIGAKRTIEVGVYTGYSSVAVALALPENGQLYAFDRDPTTMAVAQRYWEAAGVAHKVVPVLGAALEGLQDLVNNGQTGTFDFAFIDANKGDYLRYYELCLQLLRPGGLIAVDNTLFYGRPADPSVTDNATQGIREFNAAAINDQRVSFSMIPVGDGLALCRKR